ncbi:MAG: hypothetical protein L3K15_00865 [Thermoplasmata archaeon]|nr:hypothetical protein [Thermoplasmata archaeon]
MHRGLSVAIAVAVVALLLVTIVPPFARASPARAAPKAGVHGLATDSITTTDAFGFPQPGFPRPVFTTGTGNNEVFFRAYDPSDTTAIVKINDPNASRDGIGPVNQLSLTVNFNTGTTNSSYLWNIFLKIPPSIQYGGIWNITISGTTAGFSSATFFVQTYNVVATPTAPAYLPGHPGSVLYAINSTATDGPYGGVTAVTVLGTYLTSTGTTAKVPGFPRSVPAVGQGMFNFTTPTDAQTATGGISFWVYANVTAQNLSQVDQLTVPVAAVGTPFIQLGSCPSGCSSFTFQDGTPVYVTVGVSLIWGGGTAPAAGLNVAFHFTSGASPVTPTGGWPGNVTTNSSGGAAILFLATAAVFPPSHTDSVTVAVTDTVDANIHVTNFANFNVVTVAPGFAQLQVLLDRAQYFGGDGATGSWQLGGAAPAVTSGWVVAAWSVWESSSATLLVFHNLTGSAAQGSAAFTVPLNYGGTIRFTVSAHNQTTAITTSAFALVTAPVILLNPNKPTYLPGDTVTVGVSPQGQVFQGSTLWESVVDNAGNILSSGILTGGTITVNIPKIGAPGYLTVSVAAQTVVGGVIAQASVVLNQASGFELLAGVGTASNYIDGSYQPGQAIQISYSVIALGATALPKSYEINVFPGSSIFNFFGYGAVLAHSTSSSGMVPYTIPSGTPSGAQSFTVIVYFVGPTCDGVCDAITSFSVNVNPSPPALGYVLGNGSGLTVGWLILLILLVLAVLVGLWLHKRGNRPMMMKPEKSHDGATTSGEPAQWKEGTPGAGNNPPPPLPPPSPPGESP